ncbi:uncharacterized protein LOC117218823 [Megalopta genalis]|uniref:uncharacterized protein LOC117218823 n=1 Tax=Megalopta genalis TaxID=115081 RepID=UPI003FD54841
MQRYNTVTVLKLPDSRINAFGVMQIAEMLTNIGCLRDLDLDMNPNAQENFHLLCQPAGNLLFLSLRHCKISDEGVKKIANELRYRDPPNDPKLISLSLSNNRVTCEGAAHLGSMLRTNRSLKSLSLLANRMCDDGAWAIIKELKMYVERFRFNLPPLIRFYRVRTTLEHEEIVDLRRKRFEELTSPAEELVSKESNNDSTEEKGRKNNKSRSVRSSSRRSKTSIADVSIKALRTGSIDQDLVSTRKKKVAGDDREKRHPFGTESFPINGALVSTGNMCLQYLDLSCNYCRILGRVSRGINRPDFYVDNHLTKYTLKDLINCLYYQNFLLLGDRSMGLLHVILEGGGFETEDEIDWATFEELLRIRRKDNAPSKDAFQDFVSPESRMLREKIEASENAAENSSNNFPARSSKLDE